MGRVTMGKYVTIALSVLELPRRTREMLEAALKEKREAEDVMKKEEPGQPTKKRLVQNPADGSEREP